VLWGRRVGDQALVLALSTLQVRGSEAGPAPRWQRWDKHVPSAGPFTHQHAASSCKVWGREGGLQTAYGGARLGSVTPAQPLTGQRSSVRSGFHFALARSDELWILLSWRAGNSVRAEPSPLTPGCRSMAPASPVPPLLHPVPASQAPAQCLGYWDPPCAWVTGTHCSRLLGPTVPSCWLAWQEKGA